LIEKISPANESEKRGVEAASAALEAPTFQLIKNSRVYEKAKTLNQILGSTEEGLGFNADTEQVENLHDSGVLDPARALREALALAMSHAKSILTTAQWDAGSKSEPDDRIRRTLLENPIYEENS
jgi:chaperonin GroEL